MIQDWRLSRVGRRPREARAALRRFRGSAAFGAVFLAGCITDGGLPDSGVDQKKAAYTAEIAHREIDALDRYLKDKAPAKASGPHVVEGLRALLTGEYIAANRGFQRALKYDPRNSFLHMLNALAHQLRGEAGDPEQFELAKVGYELAARMDPGFSQVPYFLGVMKFRQQRFHEAREQFARAVTLEPNRPEFLTGLAASSYYLGELDLAYNVAKRAAEIAPEDPEVLRTGGIIFAAVGDFDDAEKSRNALGGVSATRQRYVGRRIDDWSRYYASSGLMNDPKVVELLAQNLDSFGVPKGGMFDPSAGSNEDPTSRSSSGTSSSSQGTSTSTSTSTSSSTSKSTTTTGSSSTSTTTKKATTDSSDDKKPAPLPAAKTVPKREPATPSDATAGAAGAAPAAAAASAKPKIQTPKMALVDVAIIRTEEIHRSSKGVNLLDGLNIFFSGNQFLQFKTPLGLGRIRTPITANDTLTLQLGTAGAGLTYSLNIFNDDYDRNEVIARPTILVEDQKKSSFFSGGTMHIVIEGGVAGSGAIEPIDTGVQLEVTPAFLDADTIDMNVFAQRTFLESSLSQVSDTITGTSFAQTSKTSISANLTLRYGETMVLSGLSDQEKEKLDNKTPGLGDLPGIQYLFRRQTELSSKKTVLVLLTPRKATLNYDSQSAAPATSESTDATNIAKLEKSAQWMQPAPHLKALVRHLSKYEFFNHFRTGDMQLENWAGEGTVLDAIKRTLEYLYIYYNFDKKDKPEL